MGTSSTCTTSTPSRTELTGEGGKACDSGSEVAKSADVVITMVPDTPHVEAALFGRDGVAEGLSSGKIVVDMSSISPIATKDFAKRINEKGCDYLDAPVSGGEVGAKQASLTIMVGGPEGAFEKVKPLFELMGKNITLVGGNGDGQTTKVANQIIVALTIEAVAEALLFAAKAGADPAKVRQALMGGFASSRILEMHGDRMVKRTFDPGFRIELHQKDLNLALQSARQLERVAAQHGDRAGAVQQLRRARRQRLGPLGHGPGARDDGQLRDRRGQSAAARQVTDQGRPAPTQSGGDAPGRRGGKREHRRTRRAGRALGAGGSHRCQASSARSSVRSSWRWCSASCSAWSPRTSPQRSSRSGDGFIKLIKMIIGPIVFCVVVHGIAGAGDLKRVGRVGLKAVVYFEVLTTFALLVGIVLAYAIKPGVGMNIDPQDASTPRRWRPTPTARPSSRAASPTSSCS